MSSIGTGKYHFVEMDRNVPASLDLNVGDTLVLLRPHTTGPYYHFEGLPTRHLARMARIAKARITMVGHTLPGQPEGTEIDAVFGARSAGSGAFEIVEGAVQPHLPPRKKTTVSYTVS